MIIPSLALKNGPRNELQERLRQPDKAVQELAKIDLEKKVYPEILDRLTNVNEWLIRKIVFAGALLGAFLLQVWWPFWSKGEVPIERRKEQVADIFYDLLKSPQVCAVLGVACIVSLFMDMHISRSLLVVQQLGVWAAEYADRVLGGEIIGGEIKGFPGWEQFIRMPNPTGMHQSKVDAFQSGNLGIMTLVLFTYYHWTFQAVCRQKLDEFNRLTYRLFIVTLLVFVLGSHLTSGNLEFRSYGLGPLFSNFWSYLIAWFIFSIILVVWDKAGVSNS
jgi:hypothetical protein